MDRRVDCTALHGKKRRPGKSEVFWCASTVLTRSQAVARIADRTASQQTLVISDALPMKLHAYNSTSFRLLYRSTIRITPR